MPTRTLKDLAEQMRGIDIAMLSTITENGYIAGRPMSNNGEVEYDGTSYYFTHEETRTVGDIRREPKVALAFQGKDGFSLAVEGQATLSQDRAEMQAHWTPDLDRWFEQGLDTPGLTMVTVVAERAHYWAGSDEGEVTV
ncbi:pyridoxamine 5'-phosphate oxidase family protein [Deinococcus petrolearius]|uniref:Pyridoxamine 5'-phosphate oxidase family protein n=1 Tax=Deinococcus petrolearius TaxID=1751295 RepID=A0ABW1DML4_9DEIO